MRSSPYPVLHVGSLGEQVAGRSDRPDVCFKGMLGRCVNWAGSSVSAVGHGRPLPNGIVPKTDFTPTHVVVAGSEQVTGQQGQTDGLYKQG